MAVTNFQLTPLDPGRSFLQGQAMGQEMRSNKLRDLVMQQQAEQNQQLGDLKIQGMERDNKMAEFRQNLTGVGLIGAALKETRPESTEQAAQVFNMMKQQLGSAGFDVSDLGEFDPQQMPKYAQAYNAARHAGLLKADSDGVPAGLREFMALSDTADLSPEERRQAARVEMGLVPRASISAAERIAQNPETTEQLATSRAAIKAAESGASEQAKADVQLAMKPKIQEAVKVAEQEAASRGEELSALNRAKASLPGLQEVAQKLKTLADVATYTVGGQVFDEMVKQLGFGATEGATARAKMVAIVDNQVLPLLRDTFGAAFTAAEGDRLRDTFMDPNATPEQKKATLDAFIEQKVRNIETSERAVADGSQQGSKPAQFTSQSGIQFTVE